jgi:uncharacterized protein YdaU (DUF1376 family)
LAEFPALPLFTDLLLADTGHLSHEEFGAYMRILILIWRSPDCRIRSAHAWLMRRKDRSGAFYTQKRLLKEFLYVRESRQKKSDAAKSRWETEKTHANAMHPTLPHPHHMAMRTEA